MKFSFCYLRIKKSFGVKDVLELLVQRNCLNYLTSKYCEDFQSSYLTIKLINIFHHVFLVALIKIYRNFSNLITLSGIIFSIQLFPAASFGYYFWFLIFIWFVFQTSRSDWRSPFHKIHLSIQLFPPPPSKCRLLFC